MGITKPSTQLHPLPPSSIYLHSAHFKLQPAHLSLPSALCNTLNVIRTLILHVSSIFAKFRPKNSKLSILTKNWLCRELGGADSKYKLSFLKFGPENPFLDKFGPKKLKLSFLPENWHTWYLEDVDSYVINLVNVSNFYISIDPF